MAYCWREKDSDLRRLSQQIYSLPPLTAREPLHKNNGIKPESQINVNNVFDKIGIKFSFHYIV